MHSNTNSVASLDVSQLPKNAQKELYNFYSFLVAKHAENKGAHKRKQPATIPRFTAFLSEPIKNQTFVMLNRAERNAR